MVCTLTNWNCVGSLNVPNTVSDFICSYHLYRRYISPCDYHNNRWMYSRGIWMGRLFARNWTRKIYAIYEFHLNRNFMGHMALFQNSKCRLYWVFTIYLIHCPISYVNGIYLRKIQSFHYQYDNIPLLYQFYNHIGFI